MHSKILLYKITVVTLGERGFYFYSVLFCTVRIFWLCNKHYFLFNIQRDNLGGTIIDLFCVFVFFVIFLCTKNF